ncbi:MAG: hypothetical protein KAG82_02615 [Alcanivoracaceae bacterium]|nr:hypothetical protein [Alcanivoracaceae bacterium]
MSITTFKRSSGSLMLAAFAAAALTTWTVPASAELSFSDISADTAFARDRPQVAKDSDGNYHIVYRMGVAGGEIDSSMTGSNVGYMMVAPNGDVLIDEVKLAADNTVNIATADVEVGSDDKVYVSFHFRSAANMQLIKLDPSLAPQDGTAPALGTITDVAAVNVAGSFNHPFIELDDADNVYIWSHNGNFGKYDSTLTEVVAITQPFSGPNRNGHSTSPMALDSDGNVHVVFQDCDTNLCTVSYGMLDGTDGSVLIDQTNVITEPLSTDQGSDTTVGDAPHAVHYNIMVDSKDKVNLVWVDKRNTPIWDEYCTVCASGGTLYFAKLDPSLDDQDGSAADMTVIKTVDDVALGPYKYVQAYMGKNDSVNIFFGQRGGMSHIRVSGSGKATPAVLLATNAVSFNGWNKHYPAAMAEDGRLFWPMVENSDDGAGSKIVMGKVSLGGGGGGGSTAPALLLLVMGAAALRRRMAH